MLRAVLSVAACAAVAASAAEVPVLMWSPARQLNKIEQTTYAVPYETVQKQIEDVASEAQALVLFLQDEFSHFDFARFRGLDGAAFQQLEDALEESMSHILPAVERAGEQIEETMSKLVEDVQEIVESGDIEKMDLSNGRKLVVVRMSSPSSTGKASQFAMNDALVGQVTQKVAELTNNNYVAVWTAAKPSQAPKMDFSSLKKIRNRRQTAPTQEQKDFAYYQDRYFSQRSITAMIVVLLFVTIGIIGIFPTMEIQAPVRYQDASIPMVGKE